MSQVALPPSLVVEPPIGSASLPILELDKELVRKRYARIRNNTNPEDLNAGQVNTSIGVAERFLSLDAWPFFHAAAKTELSYGYSYLNSEHQGMALFAHIGDLLIWNNENLRVRPLGAFSRKDASRTYVSGRFGEASMYHFMQDEGYVYWDHVPSLVDRAMQHNEMNHEERLRFATAVEEDLGTDEVRTQPDFAFEKPNREVALAESKGRIVSFERTPDYKGDLKYALKQAESWRSYISPSPERCYAVGTYYREIDDNRDDPSLIAFCDPPNDNKSDDQPIQFPEAWIRRGNYGAWLIGMGFIGAGEALRNGISNSTTPVVLPVIRLGRYEFAFTSISFIGMDRTLRGLDPRLIKVMLESPNNNILWWLANFQYLDFLIAGVEVNTLRMISESVQHPSSTSLLQLDSVAVETDEFPVWFNGSVMRDGSVYGRLISWEGDLPEIEYDKFLL